MSTSVHCPAIVAVYIILTAPPPCALLIASRKYDQNKSRPGLTRTDCRKGAERCCLHSNFPTIIANRSSIITTVCSIPEGM
ncbi:hypothetical protein EV361DRAFT_898256 [Lentinula raphanica]|nr:hypothetical protein EV361DRAFT_898256 [Lentinula raphanica]